MLRFLLLIPCALAIGCNRPPQNILAPSGHTAGSDQPAQQPPSHAAEPPALGKPLSVAPPLTTDPIGTADPITLEAAASDGSWVVICQARADSNHDGKLELTVDERGFVQGDALHPFYVRGGGPGTELDELLAASPKGRWLAVKRGGRAELIDAWTDERLDLSARGLDLRADTAPFRAHRAIAFTPDGETLIYLRRSNDGTRIVRRRLGTGEELVIDPGPGNLWRVDIDVSSRWLLLRVVDQDTNHDGKIEWPYPLSSQNHWQCQGPTPHYDVWVDQGDVPSVRVVSLDGGNVRDVPGFVAPFGSALLTRDADGSLWAEVEDNRQLIAPASCGARVLSGDAERQLLLVACSSSKARRPPLELYGVGIHTALGVDRPSVAPEAWPVRRWPDFLSVSSRNETSLLDVERLQLLPLRSGDVVVSSRGPRVLVRRDDRLLSIEAPAMEEHVFPGKLDRVGDFLESERIVVMTPMIVDVDKGAVVGEITNRPLAVTPDGAVLYAEGSDARADALATGPLRWRALASKPSPEP